jgi:hypothetical protein
VAHIADGTAAGEMCGDQIKRRKYAASLWFASRAWSETSQGHPVFAHN